MFIVKSDLEILRPYLFTNISQKDFNRELKISKKNGVALYFDFMDKEESQQLIDNLDKIFKNYPLENHEANIAYMLLYQFNQTFIKVTRYRIPNRSNPKRVNDFSEVINFLLKYKNKRFRVSFDEILSDEHKKHNVKIRKQKNSTKSDDSSNPYLQDRTIEKKTQPYIAAKFTSSDDTINHWIIEKVLNAINKGDIILIWVINCTIQELFVI
jgi:hypothetical protein